MKIAKDGKPFDVDDIGDLQDNEIEIIQFLRPDGRRRRMACEVPSEIKKLAENQILSAEELRTGEIIIYSRLISEETEKEILARAVNGPGESSPQNVLEKIIKRKAEEGKNAKAKDTKE